MSETCEMVDYEGPDAYPCTKSAVALVVFGCPQQHAGCQMVCADHLDALHGSGCLDCYTLGFEYDIIAAEVLTRR